MRALAGSLASIGLGGWEGGGVLSDGEGGRGLDGVPVLLREGVGPLLQSLLALGQSLVLANRHVCGMSRSCGLVVVVGDVVSIEVSTFSRPGFVCCEIALTPRQWAFSPATRRQGPPAHVTSCTIILFVRGSSFASSQPVLTCIMLPTYFQHTS